MKADERELLNEVKAGAWPYDAAMAMGMNHKRLHYLVEKWSDRGLLECGVSPEYGWLTEKGLAA